jgi:hypothetical protein
MMWQKEKATQHGPRKGGLGRVFTGMCSLGGGVEATRLPNFKIYDIHTIMHSLYQPTPASFVICIYVSAVLNTLFVLLYQTHSHPAPLSPHHEERMLHAIIKHHSKA